MKSIQLLIPMSGQGTRYQKAGYTEPKPAIPVNGKPMIERLLKVFPQDWKSFFVMAENHKETTLPKLLQKIRPDAKNIFVPRHTEGPIVAIEKALETLNPNDPVLVSYCDYGMVFDARHFEEFVFSTDCDACLISYRGFHAHYINPTNYAFSRLEQDRVVEVREKGNFTDNRENEFASCGAYYFKSASLLKKVLEYQRAKDLKLNGEFYTSLTVQALLLMNPNAHVRVYEIPAFYQWGTPEDLKNFEYWEKTYQAHNKYLNTNQVEQVLLPMAGLGSRFLSLTATKKPLIAIDGKSMFRKAMDSLPKSSASFYVYTKEISSQMKSQLKANEKSIELAETPPGQALSVEKGLALLDLKKEVLVSACDHGVVISPEKWESFRELNCDAAVFGIRGFPGVNRKPSAFSYIRTESLNHLSHVQKISVKTPITEPASHAPLLVGTFWFKSGEILKKGIEELKAKGQKVNNELYLDGIFDYLLLMGLDVRYFELDGYMNWGDPDSLKEALYWQEVFGGHKLQPRSAYEGVQW